MEDRKWIINTIGVFEVRAKDCNIFIKMQVFDSLGEIGS